MDELINNIMILFSNETDNHAKYEANICIMDWLLSDQAFEQILIILQSEYPLPVYNTVISGIKSTIKYRLHRIAQELRIPLIQILINFLDKTTEGLDNLVINCIAGLYLLTPDSPPLISLFSEKNQHIYAVVNEVCINYIQAIYRPYDLAELAAEKLKETIQSFIPLFSESEVNKNWIEVASNMILAYDQFGEFIFMIEKINNSINSEIDIQSIINFVYNASTLDPSHDDEQKFIYLIFELTKNVIEFLVSNETKYSTYHNIITLINFFLWSRCDLFSKSEDFFNFLVKILEFIPENYTTDNEDDYSLFLEHYTSKIDEMASENEEFRQLSQPLFIVCINSVDNGYPHNKINNLFQRIWKISPELCFEVLENAEISDGMLAAASYIGSHLLPVEIKTLICQKLIQCQNFPILSLLFIQNIGFEMTDYLNEFITISSMFIDVDQKNSLKAFAHIISRNVNLFKDQNLEILMPFLNTLQNGFEPYLIISLISIMNVNYNTDILTMIYDSISSTIENILKTNDENLIKELLTSLCVLSSYLKDLKVEDNVHQFVVSTFDMVFDEIENVTVINDDFVQDRVYNFIYLTLSANNISNIDKICQYFYYILENGIIQYYHFQILPLLKSSFDHNIIRQYCDNYDFSDPMISVSIFKVMSMMANNYDTDLWSLFGFSFPVRGLYANDAKIQKYAFAFICRSIKIEKPQEFINDAIDAINFLIDNGSYIDNIEEYGRKVINMLNTSRT
ncbi:hypothetical protein TVAG_415500 [Trichomonas vaginalis G3]|uniref:Uncharacterized protein n=1 Tax=Trichomonas vaginalis (strain ATCC PRA-98 / G3) TaxID=412133 RepID=A2G304_TRIV3|nr:armadillo (ARM) repeat-containing protein family [Trichomonas vaginalis G3]EAX88458.1 hypothetical protein TVAG_415500 [Trichomonas vaginalis G3]KAI5522757.1 armadillo (ARM) repeat-containing protein family [Trichomonas vaginalis G3]|eukprot:XP_001301388.1 hypothetical protein [Trichomonas vaginalis G3]